MKIKAVNSTDRDPKREKSVHTVYKQKRHETELNKREKNKMEKS